MVRIELPEEEAQRLLAWITQVHAAWVVTNPVIVQIVSQLQQKQMPNIPREQSDGIDRAAAA